MARIGAGESSIYWTMVLAIPGYDSSRRRTGIRLSFSSAHRRGGLSWVGSAGTLPAGTVTSAQLTFGWVSNGGRAKGLRALGELLSGIHDEGMAQSACFENCSRAAALIERSKAIQASIVRLVAP